MGKNPAMNCGAKPLEVKMKRAPDFAEPVGFCGVLL